MYPFSEIEKIKINTGMILFEGFKIILTRIGDPPKCLFCNQNGRFKKDCQKRNLRCEGCNKIGHTKETCNLANRLKETPELTNTPTDDNEVETSRLLNENNNNILNPINMSMEINGSTNDDNSEIKDTAKNENEISSLLVNKIIEINKPHDAHVNKDNEHDQLFEKTSGGDIIDINSEISTIDDLIKGNTENNKKTKSDRKRRTRTFSPLSSENDKKKLNNLTSQNTNNGDDIKSIKYDGSNGNKKCDNSQAEDMNEEEEDEDDDNFKSDLDNLVF